MRVKNDWRSASVENYKDFCSKNPDIKLSIDEWRKIVYEFNTLLIEHVLETGDRVALPAGLGSISVMKKKRKKVLKFGDTEKVNLPIDWKKTKEKGKTIYNFNFHTEGYFFGWKWFKSTAVFKYSDMFYFKPFRNVSRLLGHYLKIDENYQHKYSTWNIK